MKIKSNIGDVAPRYEGLHRGVVKCPGVIQLSQVILRSFIHFKPEKQNMKACDFMSNQLLLIYYLYFKKEDKLNI